MQASTQLETNRYGDQSPPPITESNSIRWIRQNLFSGWFNSLLTILSVYFIYICLRDFIPWAYGGIWTAKSLRECLDINPDVACFSVIGARWRLLLFGFYPSEEYWRPILTFILLFVSIAPILMPRFIKYFWFSCYNFSSRKYFWWLLSHTKNVANV